MALCMYDDTFQAVYPDIVLMCSIFYAFDFRSSYFAVCYNVYVRSIFYMFLEVSR